MHDVTNVNSAENKTTKYFNFNIQSEEENYKCVCFSPEKHRLFKGISNESTQKCGAEIKRFKLQDNSSELMITDYSAAKKRKIDFEPRTLQLQYTDITIIMNELALNQVIHIHAFLSNVSTEISKWKDGKFLKIVEAKLLIKQEL